MNSSRLVAYKLTGDSMRLYGALQELHFRDMWNEGWQVLRFFRAVF